MPVIPYLWYRSTRDQLVHAFPIAQTAELDRTWYEATCQHTVPPDELVRAQDGPKCVSCLLIVGDELVQSGHDPGDEYLPH